MNFISILIVYENFLVLSLPAESYIMKMPCSWYTGVNDTGISGFSLLEEMGGWGESLHQPKIYLLPPTWNAPPPPKVNLPPPPLATKFFFLLGLSFTDTNDSGDSRVRESTISYSTLPLPLAHKHSDIYL